MANMFDMVKQAAAMKKKMKKIQKELEKQSVEGSSGAVRVVAKGDMTISSVKIDVSDADMSNVAGLEKMIASAANNALEAAKKKAAAEMSAMTGGLGGLSDMLG